LDRASGYEPEGRVFESLRAHQRINGLGVVTIKTAHHLPTHFKFARSTATVYIAVMASWAKPESRIQPEREGLSLVTPLGVEIQRVGPSLPRVEAPEGWVKKIDRAREGKVWVGYFHVWETAPGGQRVRRKKEKTLGPATKRSGNSPITSASTLGNWRNKANRLLRSKSFGKPSVQ
jgi:hypothetical protein